MSLRYRRCPVRTIPAREVKRRGIGAFDDELREGPLHVIKNDRPTYVIMTEEDYQDIMEDVDELSVIHVKESLADVAAGRVREVTVEELMKKPETGE